MVLKKNKIKRKEADWNELACMEIDNDTMRVAQNLERLVGPVFGEHVNPLSVPRIALGT